MLLTADDLDDRPRYLNVRNTLLTLLGEYQAVPIINENDTVSVEELQTTFGDNDRLAAMVTNLIRAPLLVLLSDVEGLFDGDPRAPGSKLVSTVTRLDESIYALVRDQKTGLSKGGMASKLNAARMATLAGENVIIASGRQPGALAKILAGEPVGTLFVAQGQTIPSWKRWIGFTAQPRGYLVLDAGARRAVEKQGRSLLAIGVTDSNGNFQQGGRRGAARSGRRGVCPRPDQLQFGRDRPHQRAQDRSHCGGLGALSVPGSRASRQSSGYDDVEARGERNPSRGRQSPDFLMPSKTLHPGNFSPAIANPRPSETAWHFAPVLA